MLPKKITLGTILFMVGCTTSYTNCPPIIEYDEIFRSRLYEELSALSEDDPLVRTVRDYVALRDQLRLCQ